MSYLNKAFLEISDITCKRHSVMECLFVHELNYHFPHSILQFMMDILTVKIYVKIKEGDS